MGDREHEHAQGDEVLDVMLKGRIKDAYDAVRLPEESFARMLGQLSQAAADEGSAEQPRVVPAPKRQRSLPRYALPVAAGLVAALVAGVVTFVAPTGGNDAATMPDQQVQMEAVSEDEAASAEATYEYDVDSAYEGAAEGVSVDSLEEGSAASEDVANAADAGQEAAADGEDAMLEAAPADAQGQSAKAADDSPACDFTTIETASGDRFQIVCDAHGDPQAVGAGQTMHYLEDAQAYREGSHDPEPCSLYVAVDGSHAVSFEGDPALYLVEAA